MNDAQPSAQPGTVNQNGRELPPWFKVRTSDLADLAIRGGFADLELAGAILRLVALTWTHGPPQACSCGIPQAVLERLVQAGIVEIQRGLAVIPWMAEARAEAVAFSARQSRVGKLGGRPPGKSLGLATANPPQTHRKPRRGEESREEKGATRPPPTAGAAAGERAPHAPGGNALTREWDRVWSETRLGTTYGWTKADAVALDSCLKLANGGGEAEVIRRIGLLLRSTDPWWADKATPRQLLSSWNRFAVEVVAHGRNGKPDPLEELIRRSGGIAPEEPPK